MPQTPRKLHLAVETLRRLSESQQSWVRGGIVLMETTGEPTCPLHLSHSCSYDGACC